MSKELIVDLIVSFLGLVALGWLVANCLRERRKRSRTE